MLNPGHIVGGKYRIVRLIGDGGMGTVYEAEHVLLGSRVALKFLHPDIAEQPNLKQRFLQEARVSATVKNPHIVQVTDVDASTDGAYLVMELLSGEPLTSLIAREGRLDVEHAVHFALQISAGLEAAHQRGIVHRDLKPDNVFVTPGPEGPLLKLLDFGIAKLRHSQEVQMTLTRPGAIMGTPEYMAPEQAFGADAVDERSDIYSLGVILFEMLSGRVPVPGQHPQEIAERILRGQVLSLSTACPGLPETLTATVHRAMSAHPEQRFSSVAEMRAALLPFAPIVDRQSLARSGIDRESGSVGSRGFGGTGMATPFTSVARTQPPDDLGPPIAPHELRTRTQSMPEARENKSAAAPYVSPMAQQPTRIQSRGASSGMWLAVLGVALLGSALFGWYYYDAYVAENPTEPPQPVRKGPGTPSPSSRTSAPDEFTEAEPFDPGPRFDPPRGNTPVPRAPGPTPRVPPITLPSELPPLPSGIPTQLPSSFPTTLPLPGFPAPAPSAPQRDVETPTE